MTNILTIGTGGGFEEIAHGSAAKAISIASDGSLTEIAPSGTQKVLSLSGDGGLQEVSVTFGGGELTVTPTANANSTATTSSITFSSQTVGTPSDDRRVAVAIVSRIAQVSSVTIGGVSATQALAATGIGGTAYYVYVYYCVLTSGTTADIVVDFGANATATLISVYSITGSAGVSVDASANGSAVNGSNYMNTTFALHAGGVAIWAGGIGGDYSGTLSSAVRDVLAFPGGGRTFLAAHISASADDLTHNEVWTENAGGASHVFAGVSFKP